MAGTGLQPLNIFLIVFPFALSFAIFTTRVWKRIKERQYAIEDTILVIAEALLVVLTATVWKFVMVSYAGYHAEDVPEGAVNAVDLHFWRWMNNNIYNPILGLVKISYLITLQKLRSSNRLIIASLWALIVINGLFIVAATLGSIFKCWPVHKSWHPEVPGYCGPRPPYIFGTIGVTIATDVLVALIPAWILYDLQMSPKHKIGVIMFLSLPLAVTAIGCYRLHMFAVVFSLPTVSAEDPHNVRNALSNIEANLGVIAACGPTIKYILGRFIPYFDTSHTTKAYPPNGPSHFRQHSLQYQSSEGDVELQPKGMGRTRQSINIRNSCWNVIEDDADSEQCITVEKDGDIRKTTMVEWKTTRTLKGRGSDEDSIRKFKV